MAITNFKNIDEYERYLERNFTEVEALFHDFLIGVTSFFRELWVFETLEINIIPQLFASNNSDTMIRIWVAGCSIGEEVYSIGMLLQEQMEILNQIFKVQIFATDIDSRAIAVARSGIYPPNIFIDVSSERLNRFFIQESNGDYRIKKTIRNMIVFSEQDLFKDPPFSKLNLLSCRNLMIYINKELKQRTAEKAHLPLPLCFKIWWISLSRLL
jgi:two-component system CheB/CheR fusion protein